MEQGIQVAVFGMSMQKEDVLVRGISLGYDRVRLQRLGVIDLEWVYTSLPLQALQVLQEPEGFPGGSW